MLFADSTPGKAAEYVVCTETTTPIAVGLFLAHPMTIGGIEDWYIGDVLRHSKPHWYDVNYSDGKLWVRARDADRDVLWHVVKKV